MTKESKDIITYLMVLALLVAVFSGCSSRNIENNREESTEPSKVSFTSITPEEAKMRLDRDAEVILLDVRTKEEYGDGHIEGSILIPVDNLEEEAGKNLPDKETPIFVYCRSGNRSLVAANILVDRGYTNVYDLGGIGDWPYGVVK